LCCRAEPSFRLSAQEAMEKVEAKYDELKAELEAQAAA
jgi:hypothetical protein